jgi:hypothetical protein
MSDNEPNLTDTVEQWPGFQAFVRELSNYLASREAKDPHTFSFHIKAAPGMAWTTDVSLRPDRNGLRGGHRDE